MIELQASPRVIEHPPPDFLNISEEMAIKHIFSFKRKEWSHEYVRVKLDEVPFAKGGIRIAYHLQVNLSPLLFFFISDFFLSKEIEA